MAWIERIEIEEGFLDGLDLEFSSGFNAVIGARGTGKTSLLELIRFALGAPAFTEQASAASDAQVRAVLGRGKVSLTVRDADGGSRVVSRTIGSNSTSQLRATVLAQNEIEAVGASAAGRLHLIDRFLEISLAAEIEGVQTELVVVGKKVDAGRIEVSALVNRLAALPELEARLSQLRADQAVALVRADASDEEKKELAELQNGIQVASLREELIKQTVEAIDTLLVRLRSAAETSPPPEWPEHAGVDPALSAREAFSAAVSLVYEGGRGLSNATETLKELRGREAEARIATETQARVIRRRLGAADEEVAALANEISKLNEAIGNLKGLDERRSERVERLKSSKAERQELDKHLEKLRQERFDSRASIVTRLNTSLRPTIQLELVQSAEIDSYINLIVAALRGSGLHSKTLAPELAGAFAPLELVELVENRDVSLVVEQTTLSTARVEAAFERLRSGSLNAILGADIGDAVELFLLDGGQSKPSESLSIGQRCTAVLPLLLERHGDVLIIDQPEDHLDNAFVSSTLAESLRNRSQDHQIILSSHNANVPVLGAADRVIYMRSNGRRGFIDHAGGLDERNTVQAITDVMEGGVEAFRHRADFYRAHGYA